MNRLNGWIKGKKFKNLVPRGARIPFIDTVRRALGKFDLEYLHKMNQDIIQTARRNGIYRKRPFHGYQVVAIDGVELFKSTEKSCEECLTRDRNGKTEYFHKAVVCMNIGSDPRTILDLEMLYPKKDGSNKDEGEQTGAKRLVDKLYRSYHHFADIVVTDALFLNNPFISEVHSRGIDVVIRMKDERLDLMKDARGLIKNRESDCNWEIKKGSTIIKIEGWKEDGFYWSGLKVPLCVYFFKETICKKDGKKKIKEVWAATTINKENHYEIVWDVMHKRWDIENCGFHQLKTKCSIDHCFVHNPIAVEAILMTVVIVFNLTQLYLYSRLHHFRDTKITVIQVIEEMFLQAVIDGGCVRMLGPP
jgi:hypothetical protein